MSSFDFKNVLDLHSERALNDGFFLWLWHADKIPPHIGCSINGEYFSLKVNGKDDKKESDNALLVIHQKKIATVFVKLKTQTNLEYVQTIFNGYEKAGRNGQTCLTPITEILGCSDFISQLATLLKFLESEQQIESVFGLNLTKDYTGIPAYTKIDIDNRLRTLENVKIQKYIPTIR
jgi:hypothetical protein